MRIFLPSTQNSTLFTMGLVSTSTMKRLGATSRRGATILTASFVSGVIPSATIASAEAPSPAAYSFPVAATVIFAIPFARMIGADSSSGTISRASISASPGASVWMALSVSGCEGASV